MLKFAIYISDHGYGHATRMAALAEEFIQFGVLVYVRSGRPDHLFSGLDDRFCRKDNTICDVGVRHGKNLAPDIEATKAALYEIARNRTDIVDREVSFLRSENIDLIISDIPWLVVEAGSYVSIPIFAISNFDWLFIYERLFANDVTLRPLLNTIFGLYQRVDLAFRLPLSSKESMGSFRKIEKVGLLSRTHSASPDIRRKLGLPMDLPLLLCSFGGAGYMDVNLEAICKPFPGTVMSAIECNAPNHVRIEKDVDYTELLRSSDVYLTKPGYSSFAEAMHLGKYVLYHPRHQYPEEEVLIKGISHYKNQQQIDDLMMSSSAWKKVFKQIPLSGNAPNGIPNANAKIASLIIQRFIELKYVNKKLNSVFDTGSNNINYTLAADGALLPIHTAQVSTGLGKVFKTLPDGKIRVAAKTITHYKKMAESLLSVDCNTNSQKIVIATGIHRKGSFADDLTDWYLRKWNIPYKIISDKEEADCAYIAAKSMIPAGKRALIVDVGGFSIQLVSVDSKGKSSGFSLPLGLLILSNKLRSGERLDDIISDELNNSLGDRPDILIATGLSASYLAYSVKNERLFDIDKLNTSIISYSDLDNIVNLDITKATPDIQIRYMEPHNSSILTISAQFYKILLDRITLKEINVCAYGISLGYHIEHRNKRITKRIR